ncbi:MAG: thioredoxin family protein [Acidilobaceae archaeon]
MEFYEIDFSERFKRELADTLVDMRNPVEVKVFVSSRCETCRDTIKLLKLFEEASPRSEGRPLLRVKIYNYDEKEAKEIFVVENVRRVPTVSLLEGRIKWVGIPAGEEIRALVETILRISENESGLTLRTKRELAAIRKPILIETIVTPPCPYCPYSVLLAHMFAFEAYKQKNPVISSEAIEAFENPDIADKYGVMTVPATAINGQLAFVGVPYEEDLLDFVKNVAEGKSRRRHDHWHI